MSDEEREPSAEEIAEAEALARALEKDAPAGPSAAAPGDALGAAALLRRAHAVQSAERRAEESRRLAAAAGQGVAALRARRPARLRWSWLAPTLLVPAAAAVLFVVTGRRAAGPAAAPALPAPTVTLLEAQARAASGRADLAALDDEMRAYRESLYAALAARSSSRRDE
ncbi:MAG TPA: hypothetical protein VKZ18_18040 [Polyangia bacterium]|nr:hypothetical protein [Polyangia bacterium]